MNEASTLSPWVDMETFESIRLVFLYTAESIRRVGETLWEISLKHETPAFRRAEKRHQRRRASAFAAGRAKAVTGRGVSRRYWESQ